MSSFCFSDDLVVRRKPEVVEDGAALDEPMAKLLSVVRWSSVGGGEADPRRRTTALREQLRCGGRLRQWSHSSEAQDGVVELARVRTAQPRLQLLAEEGVAVDDDVGVSAPS